MVVSATGCAALKTPPRVNSVTPSAVAVGAATTTIQVSGIHFRVASVLEWNGAKRPTTFVSSTTLKATITQSELASAGTIMVYVDTWGNLSNSVPVVIAGSATPGAAVKVTTASLATANVSTAYSVSLTANGGTTPYSWSIAGGQLPSGMQLTSSGVVTGTPTAANTYPFTARVTDSVGTSASAAYSLIVANPSASPTGFQRFFANNSFWNSIIPSSGIVDPNSANMVNAAILPYTGSSNLSNSNDWGIPLTFATPTSKTYDVACTMYCTGDTINFPIPSGTQFSSGSDHHLSIVSGNRELDMWNTSYNAATDKWSAGTRLVNDVTGWGASCAEGQHCNGAVAAGFALLGGLVRPEEILQGHIDHALAFYTPYTRANDIVCPATHTDGPQSSTNALPEGALVRLDPTFNVDAQNWPAWEKIIAKALQTYGSYVIDTAGSLGVRGVSDINLPSATSWAAAGVPKGASLSNLPWSHMQVMLMQSCN